MRGKYESVLPTSVLEALCKMGNRERNTFTKEAYEAAFSGMSSADQARLKPMFDYLTFIIYGIGKNTAIELIAHVGMLFDIRERSRKIKGEL